MAMLVKRLCAQLVDGSGAGRILLSLRARHGSPWLTVLTYHRVIEGAPGEHRFDEGVVDATPAAFAEQVEFLARHFSVVTIDDLCRRAAGGSLPRNPLLITFDDGYRDNFEHVLPILSRVGVSAAFFIATSFTTERRVYWWDRISYAVKRSTKKRITLSLPAPLTIDLESPAARRRAVPIITRIIKSHFALDLPAYLADIERACDVEWSPSLERTLADELVMTWDEVRALAAAGMDIESHTRTHRLLNMLPLDEVADELRGSSDDLLCEIGRRPRAVSYPVGHSIAGRPGLRAAVRAAGYELGFSNRPGINYTSARFDPFNMRRLPIDLEIEKAHFRGVLAIPNLGF